MNKTSSLSILLLFLFFASYAQNSDSLTIVNAKWKKNKVAKKVFLFTHHFNTKNLFLANENISYLEIKNNGRKAVFAIGAENKKLITTGDFGKRDTAIAAINGNFFDVKNGGSVDYVKVNNIVINENQPLANSQRAKHQKAGVFINDGILSIKKWNGSADWETTSTEKDILLNGPLLTLNSVDEAPDTTSFGRLRHPRTCLGIKRNGNVIMLTVDGRNANSAGMSLPELTKLMRWLGCESSINFDGGGSTTLWVEGYGDNGVVNFPTDNKKWDHNGQRKVANVILVKKK